MTSRCADRSVDNGARVSTSDPIPITIAWSEGRNASRNACAAARAFVSSPFMLKLRSIAIATDSGKSPSVNVSTV